MILSFWNTSHDDSVSFSFSIISTILEQSKLDFDIYSE